MNDNKFFNALKNNFAKYFSATLFSAIVGMLMNKYYTYIFSVEEYGILSLYLTFIIYLQSWITFTMDSSWSRVYFDYTKQKKAFFSTILNFSIAAILFWILILIFLQDYIQQLLCGNNYLYWGAIAVVIIGVIVKICNILATLENQATLVRNQTFLQTISTNIVAVLLIFFNFGIISRIFGNFIGNFVNAICYLKVLIKREYLDYGLIFDFKIFKELCPFFLSFFFNAAIIATLSYIDRVLLNSYHGSANVGIFSIAVLIGQGITMVSESCSLALFPAIITNLKNEYEKSIIQLKKIDNFLLVIFCGIFIVVFCLKDLLILIFSNESYMGAARVLPLVILGYITGAMYKNVVGVLSFHKRIWMVSFLGIMAYSVSAVMNYYLIPIYAEKGAGLALLFGNLVYSLLLHIIAERYYFKYDYILLKHISIGLVGIWLFYY